MNAPDGPAERDDFYLETYERDLDDADVREMLADELNDTLVDIASTRIPDGVL